MEAKRVQGMFAPEKVCRRPSASSVTPIEPGRTGRLRPKQQQISRKKKQGRGLCTVKLTKSNVTLVCFNLHNGWVGSTVGGVDRYAKAMTGKVLEPEQIKPIVSLFAYNMSAA